MGRDELGYRNTKPNPRKDLTNNTTGPKKIKKEKKRATPERKKL